MNFSVSSLMAGVIFGFLGLYFLRLGKSRAQLDLLLYGVALMGFPYFVANDWLLWGIGLFLTVLCFRSAARYR